MCRLLLSFLKIGVVFGLGFFWLGGNKQLGARLVLRPMCRQPPRDDVPTILLDKETFPQRGYVMQSKLESPFSLHSQLKWGTLFDHSNLNPQKGTAVESDVGEEFTPHKIRKISI